MEFGRTSRRCRRRPAARRLLAHPSRYRPALQVGSVGRSMNTHCPICGAPYRLFDRLTQPVMCKACDAKYGASSPLASFDEELAFLRAKGASELRGYSPNTIFRAIALSNLVIGVIFILLAPALAVLAFALFREIGVVLGLTIGTGLLFLGLMKLIPGVYQYRALKRPPNQSPEATPSQRPPSPPSPSSGAP